MSSNKWYDACNCDRCGGKGAYVDVVNINTGEMFCNTCFGDKICPDCDQFYPYHSVSCPNIDNKLFKEDIMEKRIKYLEGGRK